MSNPHEKARFIAMISAPSDISSYFCEAENNGKISVKMSQRLNETVIGKDMTLNILAFCLHLYIYLFKVVISSKTVCICKRFIWTV